MPGKLKDTAKCRVCGADIVAVIRSWGPLTKFEYLHAKEPYQVHTIALPQERALAVQKEEEEVQMVVIPGGVA